MRTEGSLSQNASSATDETPTSLRALDQNGEAGPSAPHMEPFRGVFRKQKPWYASPDPKDLPPPSFSLYKMKKYLCSRPSETRDSGVETAVMPPGQQNIRKASTSSGDMASRSDDDGDQSEWETESFHTAVEFSDEECGYEADDDDASVPKAPPPLCHIDRTLIDLMGVVTRERKERDARFRDNKR